jgi:hypothetical protein
VASRLKAVLQSILTIDRSILRAIQGLIDYQPVNSLYSTAQLVQLEATLTQAELGVVQAQAALDQAYAVRAETSRAFHNAIIGAKEQVIAQYGNSSLAVEMVGLRRKSDRRRPVRRQAAA